MVLKAVDQGGPTGIHSPVEIPPVNQGDQVRFHSKSRPKTRLKQV